MADTSSFCSGYTDHTAPIDEVWRVKFETPSEKGQTPPSGEGQKTPREEVMVRGEWTRSGNEPWFGYKRQRPSLKNCEVHGVFVKPIIKDGTGTDRTILLRQVRPTASDTGREILEYPGIMATSDEEQSVESLVDRALLTKCGISKDNKDIFESIEITDRTGSYYVNAGTEDTQKEAFEVTITLKDGRTTSDVEALPVPSDASRGYKIVRSVIPLSDLNKVIQYAQSKKWGIDGTLAHSHWRRSKNPGSDVSGSQQTVA